MYESCMMRYKQTLEPDPELEPDFPPSCALILLRAASRAASTIPWAVRDPLKSSGLCLFAPKILIVGKPRTLYLSERDLWSSVLIAPTLITPW